MCNEDSLKYGGVGGVGTTQDVFLFLDLQGGCVQRLEKKSRYSKTSLTEWLQSSCLLFTNLNWLGTKYNKSESLS